MKIADLQTIFDYHYWANKRILKFASGIPVEQYRQPNTYPMRSLHGTLVHLMSAEWLWMRRIRDGGTEKAMFNENDFPSLESVQARWADVERQFRALLESIPNDDLTGTVHYMTMTGVAHANVRWQLLLHVAMHGMQHRSECAQMLTDCGHSPGNLDLIAFLRES